jgi:hypothetical protein
MYHRYSILPYVNYIKLIPRFYLYSINIHLHSTVQYYWYSTITINYFGSSKRILLVMQVKEHKQIG